MREGLSKIRDIQGRILDFIDHHYLSPMAIIDAFANVSGLEQYKVTQERDFSIALLVKRRDEGASVLMDVRRRCEALFGGTPVTIRLVDSIDLPKGEKFKIVESRLTNSA